MSMFARLFENDKLKMVYKGDTVYTAPDHLEEGVGWFKVFEEKHAFLVMPYKLVPGRGEQLDKNRGAKVLKKSDGWEGVYMVGKGTY